MHSWREWAYVMQGYLAYTNSTGGPRPAVIIYPDWDGEADAQSLGMRAAGGH